MDDSLKALEERLEQLVPKGLSDLGREQMEDKIDEMAGAVEDRPSSGAWKWGMGAAAAGVAMAVVMWPTKPTGLVDVEIPVPDVATSDDGEFAASEDFERLLTLAAIRQVHARKDRGWATVAGTDTPHRNWSYEVTEEEEIFDGESGYTVRVVTQLEESIPVEVTSL